MGNSEPRLVWHSYGLSKVGGEDARALLASVYEQFTEGFDTADLARGRNDS